MPLQGAQHTPQHRYAANTGQSIPATTPGTQQPNNPHPQPHMSIHGPTRWPRDHEAHQLTQQHTWRASGCGSGCVGGDGGPGNENGGGCGGRDHGRHAGGRGLCGGHSLGRDWNDTCPCHGGRHGDSSLPLGGHRGRIHARGEGRGRSEARTKGAAALASPAASSPSRGCAGTQGESCHQSGPPTGCTMHGS